MPGDDDYDDDDGDDHDDCDDESDNDGRVKNTLVAKRPKFWCIFFGKKCIFFFFWRYLRNKRSFQISACCIFCAFFRDFGANSKTKKSETAPTFLLFCHQQISDI